MVSSEEFIGHPWQAWGVVYGWPSELRKRSICNRKVRRKLISQSTIVAACWRQRKQNRSHIEILDFVCMIEAFRGHHHHKIISKDFFAHDQFATNRERTLNDHARQ